MHTLGQDNPESDVLTLADLGGHYMAAVPWRRFEPSMSSAPTPQFFAEPEILAAVEAVNAPQTGNSDAMSWLGEHAPFTIGYLTSRFSQSDLISAVIQQHNPHDFTGRPLPSGDSVSSQALSTEALSLVNGNASTSQQASNRSAGPGPSLEPGGPAIDTLAAFNTLPLADQNTLANAAIASILNSDTHQAINRAQARAADQQLQSPGGAARPHLGPKPRLPKPTVAAHTDEMNRLASVNGLKVNDASLYSAFLVHLETGASVRPGGPAINTLAAFNALPLVDQNMLINVAIASGLKKQTRQAINRAQERAAEQQLQPPRSAARSNTGLRPHRPVHIAEMDRLALVSGLPADDRNYYSAFLVHLETGPSVRPGGPAIDTLAAFNALPLADQNTLVNAAIASGLKQNTRQAINRAQKRAAGQQLQPPGGAARSNTGPRPRRPKPILQAHSVELNRVALMNGLLHSDHSYYSAFLLHLETDLSVRPGEPAINTLAAFNALPLADQNTLVNAAIASGLSSGTRQAINRAQARAASRRLVAGFKGVMSR